MRSNTPCPGSTFSCTDCLVHTNRAGGSPLTDGGFFAEPQLEYAAYGGGNVPRPAAGQEGRHQGFYPLNSHFLLFVSLAQIRDWRPLRKRRTAEDFYYRRGAQCAPISLPLRSAGFRTATHIGCSTQARHKVNCPKGKRRSSGGYPCRATRWLVITDGTYEYNPLISFNNYP